MRVETPDLSYYAPDMGEVFARGVSTPQTLDHGRCFALIGLLFKLYEIW